MNAKELYLKETGKDRTRACFEQIPSVTEHYISWLETKVTEQHQSLQLQQTGVSGCFSKEEVVNIILEFTNIALHSNSHNLTREELRELLRVAKNGWLNNR